MWFQRKDSMTSEDYNTLSKRILDQEARIQKLELTIDTFRDQVLRKIQKRDEPKRRFNIPVPPPHFHGPTQA